MIIDARTVPQGTVVETEVCIIGGGPAGITMAREFINAGFRVVLLESGGPNREEETQSLYDGEDVGRPYEIFADSRLRYFGGTSNHWGGVWCDLPSELDFEQRDGIPHSGWPFPRSYLEPWYRRAQAAFKLGPYGYEPEDWGITAKDIPEPFRGPHYVCRVLQQGPATRFGPEYRGELEQASNLSVYLRANALRLHADETGRTVHTVDVGVLPDGRFAVKAKMFILSAGGIESARLMLLSENAAGVGLGNERDLVGRYFMLHLEYSNGTFVQSDPNRDLSFQTGENGALHRRQGFKGRFVSYLYLSDETKRALDLPAMRLRFQYPRLPEMDVLRRLVFRDEAGANPVRDLGIVARSLPRLASYVARRAIYGRNKPPTPLPEIPLYFTSEQLPNRDSRIMLSDQRDVFGLRKVKVDWRLSEADHRGWVVGSKLLGSELERAGFGQFRAGTSGEDGEWPRDMRGDQHHMGTLRMHRDPTQGVVDETCKVHGVDNLYVASCATFPTGGTFNPSYTILALALRVADQVKERFR